MDKKSDSSFILWLLFLFSFTNSSAGASPQIERLAGVYKFQTEALNWKERGRSSKNIENILEIVPYGNDQIYFRIRAESPTDGKICGIWAVAAEAQSGFLSHYSEDGKEFEISLAVSNEKLTFSWGAEKPVYAANCPSIKFPISKRKKIRYMHKILESRQYKEAINKVKKLK